MLTEAEIKQLANQELAKRYSLAGRTQMMPMRPEPADRGYFGAKGLVEDYAGGLRDAGVSTLNYLSDTDISQMASDAARLGQGMVQGIIDDPLMAAADMVPGVGFAMGAYEAEKLRDQALQAEQSGQFDLADSLRAQASSILAMSAIPGGRTARRGARMDMAGSKLPPLENAQKTQLGASTLPSYEKAARLLGGEGSFLDFGAGRGQGAAAIGADTFEPYPREGFSPTYTSAADIPDASYNRLASLNVLNVMPRDVRDQAVQDIGRVLTPGGRAVVTTRGRDVLNAKGAPGDEPMSIVTTADTYQKGFTQPELRDYMQSTLGEGFTVSNLPEKIGQAGVMVERVKPGQSSMRELVAETFPKDYGPKIVEPYVGAGIDPRTFSAGSGSTGKPRTSDIDRNLATQIQYGGQRIQSVPEINLEDYEGYPFMSTISDTSGAGDVIESINDVPVNVSRRGGQDYMFDPVSGEFVWASARDKVIGKNKNIPPGTMFGRALALKERTGKDPLFIPHSMTPTGSDYSQVADVMLSHARNSMNKTTLKSLNKEIKSIIPDWPGLEDESFSRTLNRAGGDQRKKIIDLLDKKYIDKGSLTAGQARLAISDEPQRIIRPGTLRNVGIVDTSRAPIVGDPHPIYDTGLYGAGLGRLSQPLSVYELNPAAAYLGGITPEQIMAPPRSTGKQGGLRSLEGSPLTGIITEDILRQIEMRRAMAE